MNYKTIEQTRAGLLTIFTKGLAAVNGRHCVLKYLQENSLPDRQVWVVAIGKAACSMMEGTLDYMAMCQEGRLAAGLVITKQNHARLFENGKIEVIESDHPVPSERSLFAGQRLVEFVSQVPEDDQLLVLISGGTSALVEVLYKNVTIAQLERLNQWLLANPWPIEQINQIRKSVSCIKGGKLSDYIKTSHCIQLTISDVEDNDLSVIGSGLLVKSGSGSIIQPDLPDWVSEMQIPDSSGLNHTSELVVEHHIIADNLRARDAIREFSSTLGIDVVMNQAIDGDVVSASQAIVSSLVNGGTGLYLWGGETVVDLPENPGQGGRCQSLALLVAEKIKDRNDIVLLAAGTDGTDGPGDVAGAMVDGMTIERGTQAGLDSLREITGANAGYYLETTGDLIDTGPTGTNVMDLILAMKLDRRKITT